MGALKAQRSRAHALWEVFSTALRLGLSSFGGPTAHIVYFQRCYVEQKQWLDSAHFADLLALCQFLPGPASSQLGIAIGTERAGYWGGFLAWLGFTLPSALLLLILASLSAALPAQAAGLLHGLTLVAVAVVAHGLLTLGRQLITDKIKASLAFVAMAFAILLPSALTQVLILAVSGILGFFLCRQKTVLASPVVGIPGKRRWSVLNLVLFGLGLALLPLAVQLWPQGYFGLVDGFYRAGALVFGGGHVVLPLLQNTTVGAGLISQDYFMTGYALAQAVPGPMFSFSAWLGYGSAGWLGGLIALLSVFAPSFLLIWAVLPWWQRLRTIPSLQAALQGLNAAVVGLLAATLWHPLWTNAVKANSNVVVLVALFFALRFFKAPSWLVVLIGAIAGFLLGL